MEPKMKTSVYFLLSALWMGHWAGATRLSDMKVQHTASVQPDQLSKIQVPKPVPVGQASQVSYTSLGRASLELADVNSSVKRALSVDAANLASQEVGLEAPVDVSSSSSSAVTSDVTTVIPSGVTSSVVTGTSSEVTPNITGINPSEVTLNVTSVAPSDVTLNVTGVAPTEVTLNVTGVAPSEVTLNITSVAPSEVTLNVTGVAPSEVTLNVTSVAPTEETTAPLTPRRFTINCTNLTPPQRLPVSNSDFDLKIANIDFYHGIPGNTTCTWLIPCLRDDISNVVFFGDTAHKEWCRSRRFFFYDVDPHSGEKYVLADACESYAGTGRPGMDTLVTLTDSAITEPNATFLSYYSYHWPAQKCPQNTVLQLNASKDVQDLEIPDAGVRVPSNVSCGWEIQAPEKGVVGLSIATISMSIQPSCARKDHLVVSETGPLALSGPIKVDLCEGMDISKFDFQALSGSVLVTFHSDNAGGAPGFYLNYYAPGMDELCPTSLALNLQANEHKEERFKGVNQELGYAANKTCLWNITAPQGMVVKLTKLYNVDYLADCHSRDRLVLGQQEKTMGMCDNQTFPFWGSLQSLLVSFSVSAATPRREFVLSYVAVPPGPCQGHPWSLVATSSVQTMKAEAFQSNNTANSTVVCRWLLNSRPGHHTQVTIAPRQQTLSCSNSTWTSGTFSVYDGDKASNSHLLSASCSSNNQSLVYTSQSSSLLVVYNRDSNVSRLNNGLTLSFMELPGSAVSSLREATLWTVWAMCILSLGCFKLY